MLETDSLSNNRKRSRDLDGSISPLCITGRDTMTIFRHERKSLTKEKKRKACFSQRASQRRSGASHWQHEKSQPAILIAHLVSLGGTTAKFTWEKPWKLPSRLIQPWITSNCTALSTLQQYLILMPNSTSLHRLGLIEVV